MEDIKLSKEQKREYWAQHIKQWEEGHLSQQEYCFQAGINHCSFAYWRSSLAERTKQPKSFIPLKVTPTEPSKNIDNSAIEIKLLSGLLIKVPMALGIKNIAALIKCLEEAND
jgi:hypothetical protein